MFGHQWMQEDNRSYERGARTKGAQRLGNRVWSTQPMEHRTNGAQSH